MGETEGGGKGRRGEGRGEEGEGVRVLSPDAASTHYLDLPPPGPASPSVHSSAHRRPLDLPRPLVGICGAYRCRGLKAPLRQRDKREADSRCLTKNIPKGPPPSRTRAPRCPRLPVTVRGAMKALTRKRVNMAKYGYAYYEILLPSHTTSNLPVEQV